jgi:outer membrane protein OmpA-like peptidoglycan-associated protein
MRKQTLFFYACLLLSSCVVSREKYAAALRDAELAQGRLSDQKKFSERQLTQLKQENERLQQEKKLAEQKTKSAEDALQQSKSESAARGIRIESLESLLLLWRSIPEGQFPSTALDPSAKFASAVTLTSIDADTKKQNFISSKAGLVLSPEALAQIKQWSSSLQNPKQTLWLLGFADGTADNTKASGEYALLVARAFMAHGVAASRIKISALGFSGPLCQDQPLPLTEDTKTCIAKNNRVQIILLAEGF